MQSDVNPVLLRRSWSKMETIVEIKTGKVNKLRNKVKENCIIQSVLHIRLYTVDSVLLAIISSILNNMLHPPSKKC